MDLPTISRTRERQRTRSGSQPTQHSDQGKTARNGCDARRGARPQSGIAAAPAQGLELRWLKCWNSGCSAVKLRAENPVAGNGIFGCGDGAPKIATKKRQRGQRPKSGKRAAGNPRRKALFGVVSETGGLRRLDGGVRSHMRT